MLKLASDENLNNNIVRGLLRKRPDLDIVRIQDAGLPGVDNPTVLEWCRDPSPLVTLPPIPPVLHVTWNLHS